MPRSYDYGPPLPEQVFDILRKGLHQSLDIDSGR